MFTPEGLRHLIAETGVGKVVIGTDYPFPWNCVRSIASSRPPASATTTALLSSAAPPQSRSGSIEA